MGQSMIIQYMYRTGEGDNNKGIKDLVSRTSTKGASQSATVDRCTHSYIYS